MKQYFLFTIVAMLFFSCNKNDNIEKDNTQGTKIKYEVSLSNFDTSRLKIGLSYSTQENNNVKEYKVDKIYNQKISDELIAEEIIYFSIEADAINKTNESLDIENKPNVIVKVWINDKLKVDKQEELNTLIIYDGDKIINTPTK